MAIISMLAVMKTGAAYVPFDPAHPDTRHKGIMEKLGAKIILGSLKTAEKCERLSDAAVIIDELFLRSCSGAYSSDNLPDDLVTSRSAAYVIFTSGSTGTPKGLIMEHVGACTALTDIARRLKVTPNTRWLQTGSYVFDLSVGEIYTCLLSGACLYIPSDESRMNNLPEYIRQHQIDWSFQTPSAARLLSPEEVPQLKNLLLAGEAVGQDLLDTWVGRVQLWNGWGPSECCMASTIHDFTAGASPQTIGHNVGALCWIVQAEDHNKLAPVGCTGEIVVHGPTIAREYFKAPEQTAAAFINSPPEWLPQTDSHYFKRVYKTGDLGRYNMDGTIEFIGRKDTQVKIRGFRIELGEIEFHLRAGLPGIEQVAVEAVQPTDSSKSAFLVAFLCY